MTCWGVVDDVVRVYEREVEENQPSAHLGRVGDVVDPRHRSLEALGVALRVVQRGGAVGVDRGGGSAVGRLGRVLGRERGRVHVARRAAVARCDLGDERSWWRLHIRGGARQSPVHHIITTILAYLGDEVVRAQREQRRENAVQLVDRELIARAEKRRRGRARRVGAAKPAAAVHELRVERLADRGWRRARHVRARRGELSARDLSAHKRGARWRVARPVRV